MNRGALIKRVRSQTRDFSNSIFREIDLVDYLDEAIDRIRQYIPELRKMVHLADNDASPILIPEENHYMLALYCTARCFAQDERHYQATTFMNEFESKLDELKVDIASGDVVILDASTGLPVEQSYREEYVTDNYFNTSASESTDTGVEGVGY